MFVEHNADLEVGVGRGGGEESKQKQNLVVNDRPKSKVSILVHSNVRILQSYLHLVLEWSWNGP